MVSTLWKRAFGDRGLFFLRRTYPVRRNVSPIWAGCRFFQSDQGDCLHKEVDDKVEILNNLLRNHGFNDAQILQLASLCTRLYMLNPTKNVQPKLLFFNSIGVTNTSLPKTLLRAPFLLSSSLEAQLIPCYNYLRSVFTGDRPIAHLLRNHPGILITGVKSVLAPNLELLKGLGVPAPYLTVVVSRCSSTLCRKHQIFKGYVEQAIEMGFNPASRTFILAVHALCSLSKDKWEHKWKLYRSFGLSDDDILFAFKRCPTIMALSEKKIVGTLDFYLKAMKWDPSIIIRCPLLLLFSLESRTVPRCHMMEFLEKKGMIKKVSPVTYLLMSEENFSNHYYLKFKDDFPELKDVYIISKPSKNKIKNHVLVCEKVG